MKQKRRKINKKRVIILFAVIIAIIIVAIVMMIPKKETVETSTENENTIGNEKEEPKEVDTYKEIDVNKEINDWRLTLANSEHLLPEDFEIELEDVDEYRQFDARAIKYLKQMIEDMRKDGVKNIWAQSTYRSIKRQKELFDESVNKYLAEGKTQEEAEKLTAEYINRPGGSDHNLGLAVDFNYVDNKFEETEAFMWLLENAEKYGFVLRYPKEKESITKIAYESWHWRYVGEEHAKKMNELDMCLEEYVEYLLKQK